MDVVYVSNHGGRQLDHGRGTMDVLAEVVDALGGQAEVLVDGGFGGALLPAVFEGLGANGGGTGEFERLGVAGRIDGRPDPVVRAG